jgi:hypothetical protein
MMVKMFKPIGLDDGQKTSEERRATAKKIGKNDQNMLLLLLITL